MSIRRRSPIRYRNHRGFQAARVRAVMILVVLVWGILIARNLDIAVLKHGRFSDIAEGQQKVRMELVGNRGIIYDRTGVPLSWNLSKPSVFAVPCAIDNPGRTAAVLASICDISSRDLVDRFSDHDKFCWVDRTINFKQQKTIEKAKLGGVFFAYEPRREYRSGDDWRYLLGCVDVDGHGLGGVELAFDGFLRSEKREVLVNRDAMGRKFAADRQSDGFQNSGNNAVLTINVNLQDILSQKLKEGTEKYGAKGAFGVFLEVGTSQVLAMAQYYPEGVSSTRNVTVTDMYEPGSTFKLITAACALNSGQFSPYDIIDCENGRYRVGNKWISDYYRRGEIRFREAIEYSSNIAMIKVASQLGNEKLYRTAVDFGFGSKTGIDLPGESAGLIHDPETWREIDQAAFSFGNGLMVTALQVANAYAAVGSGGELYRPYILKAIISPSGETIMENHPRMIRRVISGRTASTLLELLTGVVENGTGVRAAIKGLKIAGKTGTSRKVKSGGRGYYRDKHFTSFVGLYPAEQPAVVGYIVLDEPSVNKTAGFTAAPLFREVLMEYLCVSGKRLKEGNPHEASILNLCSSEGRSGGAEPDCDFAGDEVSDPVRTGPDLDNMEALSDYVRGKPMRTAIGLIRSKGYEVEIEGTGVVRECYPRNMNGALQYYIKCG